MNTACPVYTPDDGATQSMIRVIDCFVHVRVQQGYAALAGSGSVFNQALTIALTLYIAVIGYRLMFGRSTLSLGEFAPRILTIGAVLALATNWAAYQTLVFDTLTDGPQEVAAIVAPGDGGQRDLLLRVDTLVNHLVEIADDWGKAGQKPGEDDAPNTPATVAAAAPPGAAPAAPASPAMAAPPAAAGLVTNPTAPATLGPNTLLLGALILVLASAGVLAVAKILLALLLLVGPVFVALALFSATRGLALGWARAAAMLAVVPLFALLATAGALQFIEPMVANMAVAAANDEFKLTDAFTILVTTLIMATVTALLFQVGRTIASGWTIDWGMTKRGGISDDRAGAADPALALAGGGQGAFDERTMRTISAIEQGAASNAAASVEIRRDGWMMTSAAPVAAAIEPTQGGPDVRRTLKGTERQAGRAYVRPVRSAA